MQWDFKTMAQVRQCFEGSSIEGGCPVHCELWHFCSLPTRCNNPFYFVTFRTVFRCFQKYLESSMGPMLDVLLLMT